MKQLFSLGVSLMLSVLCFSQAPVISSFSPSSGPIGTTVTITGSNFSTTPGDHIVYFGSVKAVVSGSTSTTLTVTVPIGATYKPLTVIKGGLVARSATPFHVTYPGAGFAFGASSFSSGQSFVGSTAITDGDMDGDGKNDLIYSIFFQNDIVVRRNTSTATLSFQSVFIGGGIQNPMAMSTADLDGDGKLDLVVTSPTFNVFHTLRNTSTPGSVSFEAPLTFASGSTPRAIATGDIDGDGKIDVITSNEGSNTFSVFRNTSTGSTISFDTKVDYVVGASPEGVAVGDLNNDGKPDIAVTGKDVDNLLMYQNNSTPGTISMGNQVPLATGDYPWGVAIGDINGDGLKDLVVTNLGPNTISVFKNTSSGTLSFEPGTSFATYFSPRLLDIGDLDADGKLDVAAGTSSSSNFVSVLRNTSTTSTISFQDFVTYPAGSGASSALIADLNQDGLSDIVCGSSQAPSYSMTIYLNQFPINTGIVTCPPLVYPANNAVNIPQGIPVTLTWRKSAGANGYRVRLNPGNIETVVSDTTYTFTPAPATAYTWSATPENLTEPGICNSFTFNTCPVYPNTYTISAESATAICATDSVKLNLSVNTSGIQWFRNDVAIPGATTDSYWAKQTGTYTVRIFTSGCYSDGTNGIAVSHLAAPAKPVLQLGGATVFCEGGSVNLTSSLANSSNQWFRNTSAISGATGDSYSATQSGTYFLRVTHPTSGCYNYSDSVIVTVNPTPPAAVAAFVGPGPHTNNFCEGSFKQLESNSANGNQWYRNGASIAGATNQTYNANQAGDYYVRYTAATGCISNPSNTISLTVTPAPANPTLSPAGTQTICEGDSLLLTSSYNGTNLWYVNDVLVTNNSTNQLYAKAIGNYKVRAQASGCNSLDFSANFILLHKTAAVKPVISANGTILSVQTTYSSYQWYLNDVAIPGATGATHTVVATGTYKLKGTSGNGCEKTSDGFAFLSTGVNEFAMAGYKLNIYPNPVHDKLYLQADPGTGLMKKVTVQVFDASGRSLMQKQLGIGLNTLDLANLPQGLYSVLLTSDTERRSLAILRN